MTTNPKTKLLAETKKLEEARNKIEDAIDQGGQYSHNIISLVLRGLDDINMANSLIEELELDETYGIQKATLSWADAK